MKWLTNVSESDKYKFPNMVTGRPKSTEKHTVDQLEKAGMIGIYTDKVETSSSREAENESNKTS